MRRWIAIVAVLGSAPASAGPLADALARHTAADVTALRASADVASRCTLGAVYARRNDLPRAALYLAGCEHAELPDDIAGAIGKAARDVKHRLDQSQLAKLDILSRPEGLVASIDTLPDEPLTTPTTVWVAPGPHTIRVGQGQARVERTLTAEPRKDALVMIEAGRDAKPAPPRVQTIDLGQDDTSGSLGEEHTAPPPDIKHPSMIKGKYAGDVGPAAEGPIPDPLAVHDLAPTVSRSPWLGLRLGAGIFDDGASSARAGLALALAARLHLDGPWFIATRADWSRRGGSSPMPGPGPGPGTGTSTDPIDVLGASAGLGVIILGAPLTRRGLSLALLTQLRGDLRLASARADLPVHRAGVSLAAGAELALPGTPLTAGLRFEQGLTTLIPGARDRAALLELGLDLR